ncbi:hypothetical protein V8E54_013598 [Elaphomyces granulatus]
MDSLPSSSSEPARSQLSKAQTMELFVSFQQALPEGTVARKFTTLRNLQKILDSHADATRNQYLIFTDIPNDKFPAIMADSFPPSKFARLWYSWETGTMTVRIMPTVEHESYMYEKLRAMGLRNELVNISRTTFRFGDFSKEADSSWKRNARGWLESTGSTVQLAVTININQEKPEIIAQCWELCPRSQSSTAAGPQASPSFCTPCTQEVRIFRSNDTTAVTGDIVMGRFADPNRPQEQDFTFGQEEFRDIGEIVWIEQGFLQYIWE